MADGEWSRKMILWVIIGVRPQFIKVRPLVRELRNSSVTLIHTQQHYDDSLCHELHSLSRTGNVLALQSGTRGGSRLARVEGVLRGLQVLLRNHTLPDLLLVVGDSDPALSGAIAGSLLGIPIAHVEAGLRSGDQGQSEERNRMMIDAAAVLHFAPTENCLSNLKAESRDGAVFSGDLHLDAVLQELETVDSGDPACRRWGLQPDEYVVLTLHRAELINSKADLEEVIRSMGTCTLPVVWPIHPGVLHKLRRSGLLGMTRRSGRIHLIDAQAHGKLISLVQNAKMVITDSGGLQREAYFLGRPCVVVRSSTEFPETIGAISGVLALDDSLPPLEEVIDDWSRRAERFVPELSLFGGGQAASLMGRLLEGRC